MSEAHVIDMPPASTWTMAERRAEAERFIAALAGSADAPVTFQTFDDDANRRKELAERLRAMGRPVQDAWARVRHGTLEQHWQELVDVNANGGGVFVMVNQGDGRVHDGQRTCRTDASVNALRALFVDDDSGELTPQSLELTPSIIVKSRRGLHAYWLLRRGEPLKAFSPAQEALAAALATDRIKDLARVLRVPGFLHQKDRKAPFMVHLVQVTSPAPRYSIAEVLEGVGGGRSAAAAPAPLVAVPPPVVQRPPLAADNAFARAQAYIRHLPRAVSGQRGHDALFDVACAIVRGFRLSEPEALALILSDYNPRCDPPWTDKEVEHKVRDATTKSTREWGYLLDAEQLERRRTSSSPAAAAKRAPGEEWPDPIPFDRPDTFDFPIEHLPDWLRRFVDAVATETETAPDTAALATFSALSVACQRRFFVAQRPGFLSPVNLWTLSLLKSGSRKSRIFDLATEPLKVWERERAHELGPIIAREASERRRLEAQLQVEEREATRHRANKPTKEAENEEARKAAHVAAGELAEKLATFKVTAEPVLFVSEATPERLEELLGEQDGRAAVLSDEGGFLDVFGRYAKGAPNLDALLKGYDAGSPKVARMKKDGVGGDRFVTDAHVTLGLSAQPASAIASLRGNAAFTDKGFAWRFFLAYPRDTLGERTHDGPAVPASVVSEYSAHLRELLKLELPVEPRARVLELSPEACARLKAFEREQEKRLRPSGDLSELTSWTSKSATRLCRLAALFHAAEHRFDPCAYPIGLAGIERVLELAPYFEAHARAVAFELGADPAMKTARRALDWIKRERRGAFTRRELHIAVASKSNVASLEKPIELLAERGYIAVDEGERGRRRGPSFTVNPKVHL